MNEETKQLCEALKLAQRASNDARYAAHLASEAVEAASNAVSLAKHEEAIAGILGGDVEAAKTRSINAIAALEAARKAWREADGAEDEALLALRRADRALGD